MTWWWWTLLGWCALQVVLHLLGKVGVFVTFDVLPPVYTAWKLLPGLPRWIVSETDDPKDLRIYPRHIRRTGIEWDPLIFRLVIHYAYESKPGSGRLRTPKDTPTPRATVEVAS